MIHRGYDPGLLCHIYENLCKVEVLFFLYSAVWECYSNLPNNYYQIGSFFRDKLKKIFLIPKIFKICFTEMMVASAGFQFEEVRFDQNS